MTKDIARGTVVIDGSGSEYIYDGPNDSGLAGMVRVVFDFRTSGPNKIQCDLDNVAPADAVTAAVNLKDPRITVAKRDGKPSYARGPWCATVELPGGKQHVSWHKTKRDGTAAAAHELAIAEWHAGA